MVLVLKSDLVLVLDFIFLKFICFITKPKTSEKGKNHTTLVSIFDYQCLNNQLVYVYRSSCNDVSTFSLWSILLLNNL